MNIFTGTDSRIGWGFRLGDRADFQVLVELGPQKYTQPLANEPNKVVSNKRNTLDDLASQLWAQRQEDKRQQQQQKESNQPPSEANSWIQSWSNGMKNKGPPQTIQTLQITEDEVKPGLGIGEIDAKSVIPEDRKSDIRTSYLTDKQIPVKVTVTSTTEKLYTTKESSSNIVE
ncbi:hypothetical protein HHI36_022471 [Cryptolaemus montrouzieri]|uniref:Uncharacterized protein n=1 Tax=Cryptolaemus montrouzieri TaxID=559131 RepID=A0ABD2MZZ7_9CUCU